MSHHPTFHDLMVDVLFDEASPEEEQRLQTHLERCDACADEFAALQQTLSVTAERERSEPPEAFWDSYRYRLEQRIDRESAEATPSPSLGTRFRQWWRSLPALLPQTAPQWALQGAVAVAVLLLGLWIGGGPAPTLPGPGDLAQDGGAAQGLSDLMLASQPVRSDLGTARPSLASVRDITLDVSTGTVEIRYQTVTDVVVRGRPDDPAVQRLLQAAVMDERNPSSRLHAVKTLAASSVSPDAEVVQSLRYLAREDTDPSMRLRAVRALRALYADRPMDTATKNLLVGIVLNAEPAALRIEALDAITDSQVSLDAPSASFLYQVRSDSNRYLRLRAGELLQQAGATEPSLQLLRQD